MNITDWIKTDLFPALWGDIADLFPEREFNLRGSKYNSAYTLEGDKDNRKDSTWVGNKTPWLLHNQHGGTKSLMDCYMEANGLSFSDAVKQLSSYAGIKAPKGEYDFKEWQRDKNEQNIRQAAQAYFVWCLHSSDSPKAKEALAYLHDRGYTDEDIERMGLGFIPSQEKLFERLRSLDFEQSLIDETFYYTSDKGKKICYFNKWIGNTHQITIPYLCSGDITGFDFRQVGSETYRETDGKEVAKYCFEGGEGKKSKRFFNISALKGDKDLIVVEGEIDCLIATARGVENVVALGGSSINEERVAHAVRMGAKKITLCLDLDRGTNKQGKDKEEETREKADRAISTILQAGCSKVYVASLPPIEESPNKTDADTLIKYKGVEAFRKVIAEAVPYWYYQKTNLYQKFLKIEESDGNGILNSKQTDALLDEMVDILDRIPEGMDRDRYVKDCSDVLKSLGIAEETFVDVAAKLNKARKQAERKRALTSTLAEANRLQAAGDSEQVEAALRRGLDRIVEESRYNDFEALTNNTITLQDLKDRAANAPDSVGSGFYFDKTEIVFAGGAISVLAAASSHGKTLMLLNLALNLAKDSRYEGKKWVVLSYEEPADRLYHYLLNLHLNEPLNKSNSSNRELIEEYFKKNKQPAYMSREGYAKLLKDEERFFEREKMQDRIIIIEPKYNSDELGEYIKYLGKRGDIGAVLVDYFQLLKMPQTSGKRNLSRQEELKEICLTLNEVAKSSGLPIILAAQFNNEVVNVDMLHITNIREAADIGHISHTILGMWNCSQKEIRTGKNTRPSEAQMMIENKSEGLYIEALKGRNFRVGSKVVLDWNGNTGRIVPNNPDAGKEEEEEDNEGDIFEG